MNTPWMASTLLASLGLACTSPPPLELPPRAEVGPPREAAVDCTPPYPMMFAQASFVFADLDQGVSCVAYLEQDECVLGVFHDCTDPMMVPREWQGRVDKDRLVRLFTAYPTPMTGGRVHNSPKCCVGPLQPASGSPEWSMLSCRVRDCDNPRDALHAGLYFERHDPNVQPLLRASGTLTLTRTGTGDAYLDHLMLIGNQLWAGLNAPSAESQADDGIYVGSAAGGSAARVLSPTNLRGMVRSGENVIVADGRALWVVSAASPTVTSSRTLDGEVLALSATRGGILVASVRGAGSALALLAADSLAPRQEGMLSGRVQSLVAASGTDDARLAVATVEGSHSLFVLTATLTVARTMNLEQQEQLGLETTEPLAPFAVTGDVVGFLGRCNRDTARKTHCYFESTLVGTAVERTGVPDVETLTAASFDPAANRIWAASKDGVVFPIDRGPLRPRVQARIPLSRALGALVVDPSTGAVYVAASADGVVEILVP